MPKTDFVFTSDDVSPAPVPRQLETATASERDNLIRTWQETTAANSKQLAKLAEEIAKVREVVEKIEEPKRRLEKLQNEFAIVRENSASERADFERKIQAAAPAVLRFAINRLKPRKNEPHVDLAIRKLERLAFQPGDLSEAIQSILDEIAEQESQLIFNR